MKDYVILFASEGYNRLFTETKRIDAERSSAWHGDWYISKG